MNAPHPLPQPLTYSEQKLKELLLYVAERLVDDPEFGSVKLNNVLFYSDFYAYGDFGDPITGSTYIRLERGPAPRQLSEVKARLVDAQDAVEAPSTQFGHRRKRLVPLRSANLDPFSGWEIALVDQVIETFRPKTARELSEYSHREAAWQVAQMYQEIPYSAVFLSNVSPTLADIERGQELARTHSWLASEV